MSWKSLTNARLRHRAKVVRKGVDNSGPDWTETEETPYTFLPCLLLRNRGTAARDVDRQIGDMDYRIIHLDGELAVNDRVTVMDKRGNIILDGMFAGPTLLGLVTKRTELQSVRYGI